MGKALAVIDLQNDITGHYRDIMDGVNKAIGRAARNEMRETDMNEKADERETIRILPRTGPALIPRAAHTGGNG